MRLLSDDRFLRFGTEIRQVIPEQMAAICSYPSQLWERLASLVGGGCTAADIQHAGTHAAAVCSGYLEVDVFAVLDRPPFSLCQGSIEENASRIGKADPTDLPDELSRKIRTALYLGVHPSRLEQGLRLLRGAPCSVTTVEQPHASGAVLLRDHCLYGQDTLVDRATLHAGRHLFMPTATDRELERLNKVLEDAGAKQPATISARNMFSASAHRRVSGGLRALPARVSSICRIP